MRNMIEFLVAEYGLDKVGAYMLCSIAGDLRMHEVVCRSVLVLQYVNVFLLLGGHAKLCGT